VTSWQDKSGNDNNAVAASDHDPATYPLYVARATVGGASALLFNSGFLKLSREIFSKTLTIFCVVGPKSDDRSIAILGGSADRGGIEFRIGKPGFGNVLELNRQNEEALLGGVKKLPTDKLSVASLVVDGQPGPDARITFRLDSSEDLTANLRPNCRQGFQLIGFAAATDDSFQGYIAEIIVFTRVLGLDDIHRIEHYLSAKYNDPTYPKSPEQNQGNPAKISDITSTMSLQLWVGVVILFVLVAFLIIAFFTRPVLTDGQFTILRELYSKVVDEEIKKGASFQ
jgi:hypothetical protein